MLLDTSGLLCFLYENEPQHSKATYLLETNRDKLLTHSYVLAKLITLASVRRFSRAAVLSFTTDLADNSNFEVVWVNETLHRQAMQLLRERQDKAYSLCDAISFVLMKQRGITDSLTTDRHFEQAGFVRLLPPVS